MKLIETGDGSHTLYVDELDETYHSRHGALRESQYVFIKNGFRYFISEQKVSPVHIFELGLGTGLNALLTVMEARKFKRPVNYTAVEPFPLNPGIIEKLNYSSLVGHDQASNLFSAIHEDLWGKERVIDPFFRIRKSTEPIQEFNLPSDSVHIIYFDAFAPSRQPELWEPAILKKMYRMLKETGILVTYSSQGEFKRNLKSEGFHVETLPGPPGKKEMVRARK